MGACCAKCAMSEKPGTPTKKWVKSPRGLSVDVGQDRFLFAKAYAENNDGTVSWVDAWGSEHTSRRSAFHWVPPGTPLSHDMKQEPFFTPRGASKSGASRAASVEALRAKARIESRKVKARKK